uniref:phosphatidylinositol 4,5-bisphosphate 3-kinase catalytic subunit delta isoform n=1 Tax=Myxine glutinosa TaxID=7769 RepID=UPI00358FAC9D
MVTLEMMTPGAMYPLDLWTVEHGHDVHIDFLLPTGIIVGMKVSCESTIAQIKMLLWNEAKSYPMYNLLGEPETYAFVCVNTAAEQEEIEEEHRRLCDVRLFLPVLRLMLRAGDRAEKLQSASISVLIGKGLHDFSALNHSEVDDFRASTRRFCEKTLEDRQEMSWQDWLFYSHPPDLEPTERLPDACKSLLPIGGLIVNLSFDSSQESFSVLVNECCTPHQLKVEALRKWASVHAPQKNMDNPDKFVLCVRGCTDYVYGEHPLHQFKYVRSCIYVGRKPCLAMVQDTGVQLLLEPERELEKASCCQQSEKPPPLPVKNREANDALWNIALPCRIKLIGCSQVNADDSMKLVVKAGLFHGGELLCKPVLSRDVSGCSEPNWGEDVLEFDIEVGDLPRMARLCLVLYAEGEGKTRRSKVGRPTTQGKNTMKRARKADYPIVWVNTMLFDYKDQLRVGDVELHAWSSIPDEMDEEMLHPLGTVQGNPDKEGSTVLNISFHHYASSALFYPPYEKVLEKAADVLNIANLSRHINTNATHGAKTHLQQLRDIAERDSSSPLFEDEKDLVWFLRQDCRDIPIILSKLLLATKWHKHEDVAQFLLFPPLTQVMKSCYSVITLWLQALLQIWPSLPPTTALELLDYTYADRNVRAFAVRCLHQLSDGELAQYLLQLVQVLKYEAYLANELAYFLLQRALANRHIGHFLFWHLRAEMHDPTVSLQFGLILEAYCRGSVGHVRLLIKQCEALGKLKAINAIVKTSSLKATKTKVTEMMHLALSHKTYNEPLSDVQSPLRPNATLENLCVPKCKFMNSKMKPLWMVYTSGIHDLEPTGVIFKNGDDLRQDMLTLQMLRLMDSMWKQEGLDLRIIPYACLSTGDKTGLIEVVQKAETIANIQLNKSNLAATAAFNKDAILNWLKHKNSGDLLDRAIEEFTLSCAGYCVATYVLGIGDRHSDNIMIRETGQLFHIDFGHFLGNFKSKFGIKRERVPFILTYDFVHVIQEGKTNNGVKFDRFRKYCEDAYMILRKNGHVFLNLFALTLAAGLPELTSPKDICYLKETLALEKRESEALKQFSQKFNEALRESWKTKVMWMAHNVAKDNR